MKGVCQTGRGQGHRDYMDIQREKNELTQPARY